MAEASGNILNFYVQMEDKLSPIIQQAEKNYNRFVSSMDKMNTRLEKSMDSASSNVSKSFNGMVKNVEASLVKIEKRIAALSKKLKLNASITVDVKTPRIGGMADGGIVKGGVEGKDSVHKMLMPGELVIPTKFVDWLRDALGSRNPSFGMAAGGIPSKPTPMATDELTSQKLEFAVSSDLAGDLGLPAVEALAESLKIDTSTIKGWKKMTDLMKVWEKSEKSKLNFLALEDKLNQKGIKTNKQLLKDMEGMTGFLKKYVTDGKKANDTLDAFNKDLDLQASLLEDNSLSFYQVRTAMTGFLFSAAGGLAVFSTAAINAATEFEDMMVGLENSMPSGVGAMKAVENQALSLMANMGMSQKEVGDIMKTAAGDLQLQGTELTAFTNLAAKASTALESVGVSSEETLKVMYGWKKAGLAVEEYESALSGLMNVQKNSTASAKEMMDMQTNLSSAFASSGLKGEELKKSITGMAVAQGALSNAWVDSADQQKLFEAMLDPTKFKELSGVLAGAGVSYDEATARMKAGDMGSLVIDVVEGFKKLGKGVDPKAMEPYANMLGISSQALQRLINQNEDLRGSYDKLAESTAKEVARGKLLDDMFQKSFHTLGNLWDRIKGVARVIFITIGQPMVSLMSMVLTPFLDIMAWVSNIFIALPGPIKAVISALVALGVATMVYSGLMVEVNKQNQTGIFFMVQKYLAGMRQTLMQTKLNLILMKEWVMNNLLTKSYWSLISAKIKDIAETMYLHALYIKDYMLKRKEWVMNTLLTKSTWNLISAKIKDGAATLYLYGLYLKDYALKAKTLVLDKSKTLWASKAVMWASLQTAATWAMTAAQWAYNASLSALLSPIGLVVAAVVAIIAVGYGLYKMMNSTNRSVQWLGVALGVILGPIGWLIIAFMTVRAIVKGVVDGFIRAKDAIVNAFTEPFKPLFEAFGKVKKAFSTLMDSLFGAGDSASTLMGPWDLIATGFSYLSEFVFKALAKAITVVMFLLKPFIWILVKVAEGIAWVVNAVADMAKGMGGMTGIIEAVLLAPFRAVWGVVKGVGAAFEWLGSAIMGGLGSAFSGVGSLFSGLIDAAKFIFTLFVNSSEILGTGFLYYLWEGLNLVFNPFSKLIGIIKIFYGLITGNVSPMLAGLGAIIAKPFMIAYNMIMALWSVVKTVGGALFNVMAAPFMAIGGVVSRVFDGIVSYLSGAWKVISGLFTFDFAKVWEGLNDMFKAVVDTVSDIPKIIWSGIESGLSALAAIPAAIGGWIIGGLTEIRDWVASSAIFAPIGEAIDGLIRAIKGVISFFGALLTLDFSGMGDPIKEVFKGVAEYLFAIPAAIVNGFGNIVSGIYDWFTSFSLVNVFSDWIGGASGEMGNWAETFPAMLGKMFEDVMNTVIGYINEFPKYLTGVIDNAVAYMSELPDRIMNFFANGIPALIEGVVNWIKSIPDTIIGWFKGGNANGVGAAVSDGLGSSILSSLVNIVTSIGSILINLVWGILKVVGVILWNLPIIAFKIGWALISGIAQIFMALPKLIWGAIVAIPSMMLSMVAGIIKGVWTAFVFLGEALYGVVARIPEMIGAAIRGAFNLVGSAFDWIEERFGFFGKMITFIPRTILSVFSWVFETLAGVFGGFFDSIFAIPLKLFQVFTSIPSMIGDALMGLGNILVSPFADLWDYLSELPSKLFDFFSSIPSLILSALSSTGSMIGDWFSGLFSFSGDKGIVTTLVKGLKDGLQGVWDWISGLGGQVVDSISSAMTNLKDMVLGWVKEKVNDWIIAPMNKMIALLNNAIDYIPGFGKDTLTAFTPLATGAVVTEPTKALVGEAGPEAVVPLSGNTSLEGAINSLSSSISNLANMITSIPSQTSSLMSNEYQMSDVAPIQPSLGVPEPMQYRDTIVPSVSEVMPSQAPTVVVNNAPSASPSNEAELEVLRAIAGSLRELLGESRKGTGKDTTGSNLRRMATDWRR